MRLVVTTAGDSAIGLTRRPRCKNDEILTNIAEGIVSETQFVNRIAETVSRTSLVWRTSCMERFADWAL